ncbi:CCA tRNA nucleotidyltransferase, mitochondrial [Grifola frondosa]|uniref:CCA tRNA nucleotidyltransferase, mitochondrial n=1 Tax=Grifola frondosa TaxID=5627 RepID=A0A1C7MSE7_GRIFR|nr:CCA tRNA nucleotidyltransferase, mitochondrial [Grifola frondosa]
MQDSRGWVRDKLLGSHCNDVDIALTDMMGVTFAEHFVNYCSTVKHLSVKGIAKIESNPDQSKHLETARTTILGIELDFVNLRSEEYAGHSRIPTQVAFGTPLQDALRRDITINALFYNVHSRLIEDHTGKGLEDMRSGIIRTPLPPRETFTDDPLRVLRCIRFASRFGFIMVPELQDAARDAGIQEALASKISRERVGEELDKMMKSRNPLLAIKLIDDLTLRNSTPCFLNPQSSAPASSSCPLASLSLSPLHPLFFTETSAQPSPLPRLFLACALTPHRMLTYKVKGKLRPAVEAVIREGLKLGVQHHYLDGIPALFTAADLLQKGVADWESGKLQGQERVALGLLLRERPVHNPHTGYVWATSLLFSLLQELAPLWDWEQDRFDTQEAEKKIAKYNTFMSRVEELELPAAVDAKTIVDGHEVVELLGASKPGPWTGHVLARVIEWQLEHPQGTKDECEAWLAAERQAGRITVEDPPASKRTCICGTYMQIIHTHRRFVHLADHAKVMKHSSGSFSYRAV